MHQFFPSRKSSTPGGAAQPASERNTLGSAEQPAGSAGQPASSIGSAGQPAIRSIADVDKLLKADASLLRRFETSKRIEEVVACLRSKPKQSAIEVFFPN